MDSYLIYAKTASGEEAMLHRKKVTQRSLRTVLILVDGQSSVADLCTRTGNREQTEEALAELEKGGFIVVQVEEDSLWIESKKVEEEIRAAASSNPHPLPPISNKEHSAPPPASGRPSSAHSQPRRNGQVSGRDSEPHSSPRRKDSAPQAERLPDHRVFVHSRPQGALSSDFTISKYSFPPMVVGRTSTQSSPRGSRLGGVKLQFKKRLVAGRQFASSFAEQMRAALRQMKPWPRAEAPLKLIRRTRRRGSLVGTLALTLLIVIALLSLTLVFFPYKNYLSQVEAQIAQVVGRPVKLAAMRITAYPVPAVVFEKLSVGDGDEAIRADEMRLEPVLASLLEPRKMFRKATFSGVSLSAQSIVSLASLAANSARPNVGAGIEKISFEKTDISFGGRVFTHLEGDAELSAQGILRSLRLRSADRHLELAMTPVDGRIDFSLEGLAWRPAKASPYFFDSLSVKGDVEGQTLTIRAMELRLLDGLVKGIAVFGAGAKATLSGELWFERVNAERLLAAAGVANKLTGEAAGRLRFQGASESWPTLLAALSADGDFTLRRGSLRGVDFAEAVRRVSKTPVQGGVTQFEQLSGRIRLTPTDYLLTGLEINSGLMQSTGRVQVGKDARLNGRMELKMRGSIQQTSVPLSLSGTLENTVVQVGRN